VPDGACSGTPAGGAIKLTVFSTHRAEQLDRVAAVVGAYLGRRA
jgi:hypothetical protein